jgi:hypothetical protein
MCTFTTLPVSTNNHVVAEIREYVRFPLPDFIKAVEFNIIEKRSKISLQHKKTEKIMYEIIFNEDFGEIDGIGDNVSKFITIRDIENKKIYRYYDEDDLYYCDTAELKLVNFELNAGTPNTQHGENIEEIDFREEEDD